MKIMLNIHKYRTFLFLLIAIIFSMFLWLIYEMGFSPVVIGICTVLLSVLLYISFTVLKTFQQDINTYTTELQDRVQKVSIEALNDMPMGILMFDNQYKIEWANVYMMKLFPRKLLENGHVSDLSEELHPLVNGEKCEMIVPFQSRNYKIVIQPKMNLIYFFDVTEHTKIKKLYQAQKTVIALIYLDNYDEITKGLDDQARSSASSLVTSLLNDWALEYRILLKRVSSDRFLAILDESILVSLEKNKFTVLDQVREKTAKTDVSITLSIGIGSGNLSLPELGVLAQSSLDLALGRGGDQVAIKSAEGKVSFYGGKTNPIEKRNRVRARVISHALQDVITDSENIFVMGHKCPDMDSVGAAIGVLKMVRLNNRQGYLVLDTCDLNKGVRKLIEELKSQPDLWSCIISNEEALELAVENSLVIVVDTHKVSMVTEERLLDKIDKVVVIDHHRRGEGFIKNPLLVYMEPYASSASELVTELLEYQQKPFKLSKMEATALLAGIVVDTKNFTFQTGSRTFDAASFLRIQGADTIFVQRLLREDIENYLIRASVMEQAYFYQEGIIIAVTNDILPQIIIAKTADTLLTMSNVTASFVIARKGENEIGISAISLGDINVQVIMEDLGGGGHLTNAAVQLHDITVEEAEKKLHNSIDMILL